MKMEVQRSKIVWTLQKWYEEILEFVEEENCKVCREAEKVLI